MTLSARTVVILKACHPLLVAHREAIGTAFYELLFRHSPELKNIFNLSHFRPEKDGRPGPQILALIDAVIIYTAASDQLAQLSQLVERVAHKHVSFGVKREHYPVVGRALIQALQDVLGKDIFTEEVEVAVREGFFYLAHIFIRKEEGMMVEKEEAVGGWRGWRRMLLMDKVVETPIHTSFYFAPEDEGKLLRFLPGQYISIRIPGSPFTMVRNYSLSSSPMASLYRITVKREKDGEVSSYLHDSAKKGQVLEIGVPCGEFIPENDHRPIVLIGAGIGITPLLSMLKDAADRSLQATLIYRAHSQETYPLRREVENIVSDADDVHVHLFYSVNSAGKDTSQEYSANALEKIIPTKEAVFYLCGPPTFLSDSISYLKTMGVRDELINMEQFGPLVEEVEV